MAVIGHIPLLMPPTSWEGVFQRKTLSTNDVTSQGNHFPIHPNNPAAILAHVNIIDKTVYPLIARRQRKHDGLSLQSRPTSATWLKTFRRAFKVDPSIYICRSDIHTRMAIKTCTSDARKNGKLWIGRRHRRDALVKHTACSNNVNRKVRLMGYEYTNEDIGNEYKK